MRILSKCRWMSLLVLAALVACKSTPMTTENMASAPTEDKSSQMANANDSKAQPTTNTMESGNGKGQETSMATPSDASAVSPLNDPNNILSKRSIYFQFDSTLVKPEFRPLIEAHAQYVRENPSAKVMLQGNADGRGSTEYNLSLGQERSVAVKKMFNLQGVKDTQLETISYGEEKANKDCADESCYQKDRRVDIVYAHE